MKPLWLEDLWQDIRISLRGLVRTPVMTLTIVATVGLGIGATTVIFSAVNAALLRPLPYPGADRLVRIYTDAPPNRFPFSVADFFALQAQQTHFTQVAGYRPIEMAFSDANVAERLRGRLVTWTYFGVLGIQPALGHDFSEPDGQPGGPHTVIISHSFWQRRLGGRPDVVGQAIRLDGSDYMIAGVLPQAVGPLERQQDFFAAAQWTTPPRKGPFFITALGRLRSEAGRRAAADELHAINRRIFPIWQSSYQDEKATWSMIDLKAYVVGDVQAVAGLAFGAVALVWLIACANASNLLIARVTSRRRELAVRAALGASRGRVVRHLLAESLLLALGSAAIGFGLARSGLALLRAFGTEYFPRTQEAALDGASMALLTALTLASALLFGLVPALSGSGRPTEDSLRASERSSTGTVALRRLRRLLVASQFAIATPLLVVAGLLLASLNELGRVNLGFNSRNLMSGSIALPMPQYPEPARVAAFWNELQDRVEALPGVVAVAFADGRPPNGVNNFNNFDLEESPTPPGQSQPVTPWIAVTPDYFHLLGLGLQEGRLFDDRDGLKPALESVVVDRAWARRFFPNQSAIGKRFKEGGCTACPWTTVVGVVSEVKYAGLDKPDEGTVYMPMPGRGAAAAATEQTTRRYQYLLVRTESDPASELTGIRRVIRELDPNLALSGVATVDELVAQSLQRPQSLSLLVTGFALVALALSFIGIYGVMAYYVQQHSKDIGIRLALGGAPGDVLRLVVGQGMTVVVIGIAIGLFTALMATRLVSSLLFEVGAADPLTFVGVSALSLAVALVACLVPAARATRVQPAIVLRNE
jgi:putative ABC transport system permease protein